MKRGKGPLTEPEKPDLRLCGSRCDGPAAQLTGSALSFQAAGYHVHRIPRSREVQQSWLSTVFSTLHAAWLALPLTYRLRPDLVRDPCLPRRPSAPRVSGLLPMPTLTPRPG